MKIKIKRFNSDIPLPIYATSGAAAFDLTAREDIVIAPREVGYIPLNVAVKIPKNHFLFLVPRSSTHKKGLIMANSVCVGDPDFCGDEDEYKAAYLNYSDNPVKVLKGERIAQGLVVKSPRVKFVEVKKMKNKTRGGFGSTGNI